MKTLEEPGFSFAPTTAEDTRAWLVATKSNYRHLGGYTKYDDDPTSHYSNGVNLSWRCYARKSATWFLMAAISSSMRVRGHAGEPPNAHMTESSRSLAITYDNWGSFSGGM